MYTWLPVNQAFAQTSTSAAPVSGAPATSSASPGTSGSMPSPGTSQLNNALPGTRGSSNPNPASPNSASTPGTPSAIPPVLRGASPPSVTQNAQSGSDATSATPSHQVSSVFKPLPLPPEIKHTHEETRTLKMPPIRLGALIQVASMRPLELDANYQQPISLADALAYAAEKSLVIRIAKESLVYQYAQLGAQLSNFLPSFSLGYTVTKSHVESPDTHSTASVLVPRVAYPLFVGGGNVYSALVQYYRARGWKETYKSNINDTLLSVYTGYTNLALNHALLKIRVKAVELSTQQLKLSNDQFRAGTGTKFAIMQSRSQLASDKQALLAQQIATRQSSLLLGYALDMPASVNLVPAERDLTESAIIDNRLSIDKALQVALDNRPELRQYEYFRYAAARNVQSVASNLYPTVVASTVYNSSNTVSNTVSNSATTNTAGTTSSATTSTTTTSSTGPNSAAAGGSASNTNSSSSTSNATTAGAGIFGGLFQTYQQGISISESLPNLGLATVSNIIGARALSRQAMLQANQELQLVREQVRSDYITVMSAREQIDNAIFGVDSSGEALRLAKLRLVTGNGTTLEVIQAENSYIAALGTQAQAIIASDQAQAQLVHDMGVISSATLLNGYNR